MSNFRWFLAFSMAASALAPILVAPSTAHAESDPIAHRSDAGAEAYIWSAKRFGTTLAAIPFVQFDVSKNLFLNMRFPVALSIDTLFGDDAEAGLGNPTFSLFYSSSRRKLTWYVGGRASVPLGLIDSRGFRYATESATVAMALYDAYLWAEDSLTLGGLGGIEYQFAPSFVLRAGADLTLLPSLKDHRRYGGYPFATRDDGVGVEFQTKVEPEFQTRSGFGGGMGLTVAWFPTLDDNDNAQVALTPYFAYDSHDTFFMRAGAMLALDSPFGPAFDRGGVASIYLQLGGHLD